MEIRICTPCGTTRFVHKGVRSFRLLEEEGNQIVALDLCPKHATLLLGLGEAEVLAAADDQPAAVGKRKRQSGKRRKGKRLSPGEGQRLLLMAVANRKRPAKPCAIAKALRMTHAASMCHARALREAGLLLSTGHSGGARWTLTEEGRRQAEDRVQV